MSGGYAAWDAAEEVERSISLPPKAEQLADFKAYIETDPTRLWLTGGLVVTGTPTDEFDHTQVLHHFTEWCQFMDIPAPTEDRNSTLLKLARLLLDAGVYWNTHRKMFQGGRLI